MNRCWRISFTLALSLATASPLLASEVGGTADDAGSEVGAAMPEAGTAASVPVRNPKDVAIVRRAVFERDPSLAINPVDPQRLAVGFYTGVSSCAVRVSADGGTSWSSSTGLPLIGSASACYLVDLAYAPDGSHLYAAYHSVGSGIVVSTSENGGQSWGPPQIVIEGLSGHTNSEPAIATQRREGGGAMVNVAAGAYSDNDPWLRQPS